MIKPLTRGTHDRRWIWWLAVGGLLFAGGVGSLIARSAVTWVPTTEGLPATFFIVLIIPSLIEEIVFRGPLLRFGIFRKTAGALLLLALFVAWHPFQTVTGLFGRSVSLFLDPDFLIAVTGLGAILTGLTLASKRLWPAVLVHWAVVVAWKQLGGAAPLFEV